MTERTAFANCRWINSPERWLLDGERLLVVTGHATDFWRETHYGFVRDNGHLFGCDTGGDCTIQVRVRANYDALYDQAGIMVRLDERNWVKAGIEKSDGQCQLSSVLTVDPDSLSPATPAAPCGRPVLAFRSGSVPEVIEDRISGFVVSLTDDAVAAAGKLDRLSRRHVRRDF